MRGVIFDSHMKKWLCWDSIINIVTDEKGVDCCIVLFVDCDREGLIDVEILTSFAVKLNEIKR